MSIAPPRCSALPVLSTEAVSATLSAEAFPTLSAEAIPTTLSAEAIPTLSTEASPTTIPPTDDPVLEDIHPQGSSCATGGILRGHALPVIIVQLMRRTPCSILLGIQN